MKILVVEDDKKLSDLLVNILEAAGFVCDVAYDGMTAHELGFTEHYDAALLDLGLPELDGISVLQEWRDAKRNMPVLILTARGRWSEKLAGFNAGADDYLTKPFEAEEVVIRLRALIRRSAGHASPELKYGGITLDTMSGRVSNDGIPLVLTSLEFRILSYFMHHPNRIISRTEFLEHAYGSDADPDSNVIDVIMGRLRKKLNQSVISTIRGQGFRFDAPDEQSHHQTNT
ncbi:MAG: response regulator transcription factor [Rhodospirillales bacterium]|jgi:two-component system, OmpR family, response regulator|nr:response regulator transcription factor [Rhodospirillales bacterium]